MSNGAKILYCYTNTNNFLSSYNICGILTESTILFFVENYFSIKQGNFIPVIEIAIKKWMIFVGETGYN